MDACLRNFDDLTIDWDARVQQKNFNELLLISFRFVFFFFLFPCFDFDFRSHGILHPIGGIFFLSVFFFFGTSRL